MDEQNIYSAIFCLESYVFDKGLLDTETPVVVKDENKIEFLAQNDLELYYALSDKHNMVLIEKVIGLCTEPFCIVPIIHGELGKYRPTPHGAGRYTDITWNL